MRKKFRLKSLALSIVLILALLIVTGCGSRVSIEIIDKQNILDTEVVTAYIAGFKNDDATWKKLQSFAESYNKNVESVSIIFFDDKSKAPDLRSLEGRLEAISVDENSDGVVAVYTRYGTGHGNFVKNPKY